MSSVPATRKRIPAASSRSGAVSGCVMSQSIRSAGWNHTKAPVSSRSAGAAVMWSLCPCVSTIAVTRRPPIASTIGSARWGASMTSTSSSSPTSQTLLSTSKSDPSRLKTPETTVFSIRATLIARLRTRSAARSTPSAASAVAPLLARWRSLRCSLPAGDRLAAMLAGPSFSRSLVEHHDRAQHLAAVHLLERGLDVGKGDRLGDELVEREAALQVEVDQHREVPGGQAVAVPGGLDRPAPAEDLNRRQLDRHVRRRDADHHHPPGQVAGVEGLLEHLRVADRVDRDVDA